MGTGMRQEYVLQTMEDGGGENADADADAFMSVRNLFHPGAEGILRYPK